MTELTRAERLEQIERDNQPLDDTVYIKSPAGYTRAYHDDSDCTAMNEKNGLIETSRREGQKRMKVPCKYCVLEEHGSHNMGGVGGGISKLERALREDKETPECFGGAD